MKKVKYYYNTHTLRYEKLDIPLRVKLLRVIGFLAASIVTGLLIFIIALQYIDSPKEKILRQQNEDMKQNYTVFLERVKQLELQMNEIVDRDNNVYRSIFAAAPLPDSIRTKNMEKAKEVQLVQQMGESELVSSIAQQLNRLSLLSAYQLKSFAEIENLIRNKEKMLAATPAIQPIANKQLNRVSSGFGYRIDPIFKDRRAHLGLDFSAPMGTPIYATADGTIKDAGFSTGGFGNHVVINHGFGYETLYGHMLRSNVRVGENVKRGQVIGYVGNSGKSTAPHCHYEVHRRGIPVDPIYYFYGDLTAAQFDRIVKLAAASNQSFD